MCNTRVVVVLVVEITSSLLDSDLVGTVISVMSSFVPSLNVLSALLASVFTVTTLQTFVLVLVQLVELVCFFTPLVSILAGNIDSSTKELHDFR